NAADEVLAYARSHNMTKIVVGKPTHPRWRDKLFGSMLDQLVRGSGDVDVYVITGDVEGDAARRRPGGPRRSENTGGLRSPWRSPRSWASPCFASYPSPTWLWCSSWASRSSLHATAAGRRSSPRSCR